MHLFRFTILLISLSFLSSCAYVMKGQKAPKEDLTASHVIHLPGMSKDQISIELQTWFSSYNPEDFGYQVIKPEQGRIVTSFETRIMGVPTNWNVYGVLHMDIEKEKIHVRMMPARFYEQYGSRSDSRPLVKNPGVKQYRAKVLKHLETLEKDIMDSHRGYAPLKRDS